MATESTLELFIGADTTLRIDVTTTDGGATPQTMTGWALAFYLRRANDVLLVSKTTGDGITIGNGSGTDDRATVAITDTDMAGIEPPGREYRFALWRTDDGSDIPIAYGNAVLRKVAGQA